MLIEKQCTLKICTKSGSEYIVRKSDMTELSSIALADKKARELIAAIDEGKKYIFLCNGVIFASEIEAIIYGEQKCE